MLELALVIAIVIVGFIFFSLVRKKRGKVIETQEDWEIQELRRILWLHHGCTDGIYGDDGEMQCNACMLDFVRDDIEKITNSFFLKAVMANNAFADLLKNCLASKYLENHTERSFRMKINWSKLYEDRCPTVGCLTNSIKTTLVIHENKSRCPRCEGEWALIGSDSQEIHWIEIQKPIINIFKQMAVLEKK